MVVPSTFAAIDPGEPRAWQSAVRLVVEIGEGSAFDATGPRWDGAHWDVDHWAAGWSPTWLDVTADVITVAVEPGLTALDTPNNPTLARVQLLDLAGVYAPPPDHWGLGLLLRITGYPLDGQAPFGMFYGMVDNSTTSGTAAAPIAELVAHDPLATVGAPDGLGAIFDTADTASSRIAKVLAYTDWPAALTDLEADTTSLLADPATRFADVLARTCASSGGIMWADPATGTVRYRTRDWLAAWIADPTVTLAIVVGDPPAGLPAGVAVIVPTGLGATASRTGVENVVTLANIAPTPATATVTATARDSITAYGYQAFSETDLATVDPAVLTTLANRRLGLYEAPHPVVDPLELTIFDGYGVAAARLAFGDRVLVSWDANTEWSVSGCVVGVGHDIDGDAWRLTVTVAGVSDSIDPTGTADAQERTLTSV